MSTALVCGECGLGHYVATVFEDGVSGWACDYAKAYAQGPYCGTQVTVQDFMLGEGEFLTMVDGVLHVVVEVPRSPFGEVDPPRDFVADPL